MAANETARDASVEAIRQALQEDIDLNEADADAAIAAEQSRAQTEEGLIRDEFAAADAAILVLHNALQAQHDADHITMQTLFQAADQAIQAELDASQASMGLEDDGSYVAKQDAHYIAAASSMKGADELLDAALKVEELARIAADSAEETRALAAEAVLQGNIDDEETRALAAEAGLAADIVAEASARSAADSAEQAARIAADDVLTAAVAQEVSDRQAAITAEENARIAADAVLQNNINTETARINAILEGASVDSDSFAEVMSILTSIDAENDSNFASYVASNDAALASEIATARAAEAANAAAISAEETRALGIEAGLRSDLDTLEGEFDAYVVSNDAALALEAQTARAAEVANATAIAAVASDLSDYETSNDAALAQEAATRLAEDTALQSNIDAEEAARLAADGVLQSNLDAEAATRLAADTALQSNIDAEEAARIAADDVLAADLAQEIIDRGAAVSAEEAARLAHEALVLADLTALMGRHVTEKFVPQSNGAFVIGADAFAGPMVSVDVYMNGMLMELGNDYSLSMTPEGTVDQISFAEAFTSDVVIVKGMLKVALQS